jgi:subtilisin family serine protease
MSVKGFRGGAALALLALLCGLVVVSSGAAGGEPGASKYTATPLTPDVTYVGAKSHSGELARTPRALLGRDDSTPINVVIKYDYDATASYTGGIAGLKATSPNVTHKSLKHNKAAVRAYQKYARNFTRKVSAAVKKAVPSAKLRRAYINAYGGVSARVPADQVAALLRVHGVAAVQQDTLNQPQDDNTGFIGASAVWPSLGGSSQAGKNVTIGVIDTGVWPEHPMLSATGISAPSQGIKGCQFGNGSDSAHLGQPFACNNKLIGAYAFMNTYMSINSADANEFCNDATNVCSPRDSEGHGTHTLTTAGGDCVTSAMLYGVERGPVCGIAPGAHVIMYRVCASAGCYSSDSVAAVQRAIVDGVNVINFSISGGGNPYTDAVELAFLDAYNAGVTVNASAGNSGPGPATTDHGGPWVNTVAASTGPRSFKSSLHLTASNGDTLDKSGDTLTNGISTPKPVILAQSIPGEDALCQTKLTTPAQNAAATGKIVACQRGTNARVDKGFNVVSGGAAGMILYNAIKQDVETDNHWLPTIHVDGPNADLVAFITTHTGVTATFTQGTPTPTLPDMMATFSSRGPLGDFLKPNVTAPGVQVLAGMTPQPTGSVNGPPGNLYQAIAGTSMSSPHAAGVAALVKAAHPTWTPGMIISAMSVSAVGGVVKEDGTTPATPFDDGAGSVRADRAVNPTLVFDESFADYVASASDPLHRIDLNLPSVDAPTMGGVIVTKRTAINVSGQQKTLDVSVDAPQGAIVRVSDRAPNLDGELAFDNNIVLKQGSTTDMWIGINAPDLPNGQYFARATLTPRGGGNAVTIPIAFTKKQGAVTLSHTCAPTTVPVTGVSHCSAKVANFANTPARVHLTVKESDRGDDLTYTNVSPPGVPVLGNQGVRLDTTLTPALAGTIDSLPDITGNGPDGGYLSLALFGIAPIAGVGDDTVTNFTVPTFYYAGEPYTSIGVGSNGTLVIGGGQAADATPFPQNFPNTARPNNVVAPLWTDLNPGAGGAIRIATLSGGGFGWIVIDWDHVKNFSDGTTHTFEIWLQRATGAAGTGPSSEAVTIDYGPNLTFPGDGTGLGNASQGDAGTGWNWGAENRDGTSGKNLSPAPVNGHEFSVKTSPPTAGGTASVTFDVGAYDPGTFRSDATMTSDVTPGFTTVPQWLTFTP